MNSATRWSETRLAFSRNSELCSKDLGKSACVRGCGCARCGRRGCEGAGGGYGGLWDENGVVEMGGIR